MATRAVSRADLNGILVRRYTRRANSGILLSTRGIRDILRENLTQKEYRYYRTPIAFFSKEKYVIYSRGLLGNPDIDERIAIALNRVQNIYGFEVCDPRTILDVRHFRTDPYYRAKSLGMGRTMRTVLAATLPADEKFRWFCVFNHAIGLDEHTGLDTFPKILRLLSRLTPDISKYVNAFEKLWYIPLPAIDSESDFSAYHTGTYQHADGWGDEKMNYEDIGFVKVLNELLRANGLEPVKKVGEPDTPWLKLVI